jgi:hypothetical protein
MAKNKKLIVKNKKKKKINLEDSLNELKLVESMASEKKDAEDTFQFQEFSEIIPFSVASVEFSPSLRKGSAIQQAIDLEENVSDAILDRGKEKKDESKYSSSLDATPGDKSSNYVEYSENYSLNSNSNALRRIEIESLGMNPEIIHKRDISFMESRELSWNKSPASEMKYEVRKVSKIDENELGREKPFKKDEVKYFPKSDY